MAANRFAAAIEQAAKDNETALASARVSAARNEIEAEVDALREKLWKAAQEKDPALRTFGIAQPRMRTYRTAPPGFFKEPSKIVRGWLDNPRLLERTNKATVAALRERYPGYPIPENFLNRPLHWIQIAQIRAAMADYGAVADKADCRKLSTIKRWAKDRKRPAEYDTLAPVIKIAKDSSHVLWNGKRYSVFLNGDAPSIKRNGKTIRLARLRSMLAG